MSVLARMYSRASWGARYRAGFGDRSANYPLPECWTHHSVTAHLSENATVAAEKAQMRILEDIGQQRFGGGISYSFVIFPSGRIYMGTGASRRGAHTGGHNTVGIGVVFAGNYERHRPTAAAEATYAGLLRELRQVGVLRRARTNGGHKDAPGHAWNACPGRYLHARLGAINTAAARAAAPATSTPALEGEVMTSPREVWSYGNKSVEEGRQVFNMLRHAARDVWRHRTAPLSALSNQYTGLRKDGYRGFSWLQYTYLWARRSNDRAVEARNEAREVKAMLKALAKAQDAHHAARAEGESRILEAVESAEREAIKVNAADVAAELELSVKEDQEEDD